MSHSFTDIVIILHFFVFFVLLGLQVRFPVQPFSTAQGSGGVRLHQQASHPQSDQTDHPHPQQGESRDHDYFCPVITRHLSMALESSSQNHPKHHPVLICSATYINVQHALNINI